MLLIALFACSGPVDTDAGTCIDVMSARAGLLLVDGAPFALVSPYQPVEVCVEGGEILEVAEWPTVETDPASL